MSAKKLWEHKIVLSWSKLLSKCWKFNFRDSKFSWRAGPLRTFGLCARLCIRALHSNLLSDFALVFAFGLYIRALHSGFAFGLCTRLCIRAFYSTLHSGFPLDFVFGLSTRFCIRAFNSTLHTSLAFDFAYLGFALDFTFGLCTRLCIRALHSTLHLSFALDSAFGFYNSTLHIWALHTTLDPARRPFHLISQKLFCCQSAPDVLYAWPEHAVSCVKVYMKWKLSLSYLKELLKW